MWSVTVIFGSKRGGFFTYTKKLLNLLNIKQLYLSLKEYTSETKFEKPINEILEQIDQEINDLTAQIKLKFNKIET